MGLLGFVQARCFVVCHHFGSARDCQCGITAHDCGREALQSRRDTDWFVLALQRACKCKEVGEAGKEIRVAGRHASRAARLTQIAKRCAK